MALNGGNPNSLSRRRVIYRTVFGSLLAIAVFLSLYLVLMSIALHKARETQAQAESLLRQAVRLEVGRSTRAQVEELVRQFGADYRRMDEGPPGLPEDPPTDATEELREGCTRHGEVFGFTFENRMLSMLGLAPLERFSVGFYLYRGVVCKRGAAFVSGIGDDYFRLVVVEDLPIKGGWFRAKLNWARTTIDFCAPVPEDVREGAYSFSLTCLGKIGGCTRSRDVLPWIWANPSRKGVYLESQ